MRCSDVLRVRVVLLPHGLSLPGYATSGAAGMDLRAAIPDDLVIDLNPGERRLVPAGVKIEIPPGWEAQVRTRSGHALNSGLVVANSPGTIDSDYRGEIGAILLNSGQRSVRITRGLKMAQLVVAPVAEVEWEPVMALPPSGRGENGFGSTGA